MIAFLEGVLVQKEPTRALLNVGGVGYEIIISLNAYDELPAIGVVARILTALVIREDAHVLYGFVSGDERRWFGLLIGVTGIGPKLAMSVLSGLTVRELAQAVANADTKRLAAVPGVGRKTSERLVLELKDRLSEGERLALAGEDRPEAEDRRARDAALALLSLGYKQNEAQTLIRKALETLPDSASVEEVIRKALAR